jgi:putative membrane protein (TIGR04086 family)
MKIYLRALGYTWVSMLGLTLIITILHYFNLMGDKVVDISKLIISIISILVGAFIVGKSSIRKGWLEGLKYAGILIIMIAFLTLIFHLGFSTKTIIYYLIVIACSVIGSMIGISIKEKKNA